MLPREIRELVPAADAFDLLHNIDIHLATTLQRV